ncbi:hypothetical protein NDU88_011264 [Pleurodeles waltl]|uniref:Uncharacterized protein n=1 Tax=Pleurodeles waltl TaxID=8319 RepID=A0AAV7S3Q1_PLEWA|nr:hypothetical protein NDU88_011264 [Pleurodeles waltl]
MALLRPGHQLPEHSTKVRLIYKSHSATGEARDIKVIAAINLGLGCKLLWAANCEAQADTGVDLRPLQNGWRQPGSVCHVLCRHFLFPYCAADGG